MTDTLRTRIAAVAQHCREHRPEHECVCSMPPTDWDYELADAVIAALGLEVTVTAESNDGRFRSFAIEGYWEENE